MSHNLLRTSAALCCLSLCNNGYTQPAIFQPDLLNIINQGLLSECTPDKVHVLRVIRMSIPDNLSIAYTKSHIGFHKGNPKDESDETAVDSYPPSSNSEYNNNPFHIDLTSLTDVPPAGSTGDFYFEVRVVLTGSDQDVVPAKPVSASIYTFFETSFNAGSGPVPIHGIAYGDVVANSPDAANYCSGGPSHVAGQTNPLTGLPFKRSSAIFYVRYKPYTGHAKTEDPVNILLLPNSASETPIIIDPKIQNNG